ncbi:conserved hypothetical protein [Methanohalobium evestigatum Z-7303]|uniref:DUF2124 domain-containing protein n=1 Tax=Methanohalobium evestigatum (strain ATCC BAA-1072 / DSM 3721 / NBRC 107634 / OCM 161 / Z-7303) TaxID=644295 RepID=D7EAT9_METEZ|nr:DUF2124 domain-containing protein [Methanohalobium evestigatum]ADI74456.1 conserved hypothetical protein [Methanohalobium evestigatum Z-7303]
MEVLKTSEGIGGQLTGFRELVKNSNSITFIGSPGFCTPFAELFAFVIRESGKEMAFIPSLKYENAKSLISTEDGIQLGDKTDPSADTVVLLGGLAMPKMGIDPADINEIITKLQQNSENKMIIGICFQSIFQEQEWDSYIDFDYIIDSDLTNSTIKL